jgi:NitT/TauT family transport system ATP-binding protein
MAVYLANFGWEPTMDLQLNNITQIYGRNGDRRTVLRDICMSISGGEFVSLLGPSGCGKTTLLTIIAGFQPPTRGTVSLNGRTIDRPGPDRGFVFQDYALFPWMTVRENILFPMRQCKMPRQHQQERLRRLLEMARLTGSENLYPSQISGGMKQRTAVVRALASDPDLLLMDEPFGAVDYQMRHNLQEAFESLWQKNPKPVIMVTHDVEEAVYLSDRILVMSAAGGAIVRDLAVTLPRPRRHSDAAYRQVLSQLTSILKGLVQTSNHKEVT